MSCFAFKVGQKYQVCQTKKQQALCSACESFMHRQVECRALFLKISGLVVINLTLVVKILHHQKKQSTGIWYVKNMSIVVCSFFKYL